MKVLRQLGKGSTLSLYVALVCVVAIGSLLASHEVGTSAQASSIAGKLGIQTTNNAPLSGQIIVDPSNPTWLKYAGGGPFFMAGPGDPEGFLYRGTRQANGTRAGDQMALIDKLSGTGANSIYLMAVRSHGGDGDSTQNPFEGSNSANALDSDILDQWEAWFTAMDQAGITIFFFFYDDGACVWGCDKAVNHSVPAAEKTFIHGLVDRFEHHKHLIWAVAEEYQEKFSASRVSNIAAEIRAADDYDHVIAVHKLNGLKFDEFATDPNVDQFAIQYNPKTVTPQTLHDGMVTAWNSAAGRYNLNMSEVAYGGIGTGATARKNVWAVVMGGAYAMLNGMDIASSSLSDLKDLGRIVQFFEATSFNEMAPHDELRHAGTTYVLAKPGESYIAYSSNLTGEMGLKGMTAGMYDLNWLDAASGAAVTKTGVSVGSGDQSWARPASIGAEAVLYIKRTSATTPVYQTIISPVVK